MNSTAFRHFLETKNKIYRPDEIDDVIGEVRHYFRLCKKYKIKYFDIPCAFDIETSSFYDIKGQKTAIMYEWTFGIFGLVIIGRTWQEYVTMINRLVDILNLNLNKRLVVYVHNLSYEFQFMRHYFEWHKVFAVNNRKPIYALTENGIEYRCSYLLSGYSLDTIGKNLQTYKIKKLVGNLKYDEIRHSKSELKQKEIDYCVNDVKVVMAYIAEKIESDLHISRICMTKTGYVRRYCRNNTIYNSDKSKCVMYRNIIKGLTLDPDEYLQLKRAFQGGFTHANPFYFGKIIEGVTSFDFTSSYPTVMIAERNFPMGKAEKVIIHNLHELEENLKNYWCIFDVEIKNLTSKYDGESYISESRCFRCETPVVNNGRIFSASCIRTTITGDDWDIIKKTYDFKDKDVKIGTFRRYKRGYLPTELVKSVIQLYKDKTKLKGVKGKEAEYLASKEMLNSCYGMCVTSIDFTRYGYSDEWETPESPDLAEAIEKYNKDKNRFLFYPWGVAITAMARRNLWSGIFEFGSDYIYSDTDSVKVINADKHKAYIEKYNQTIIDQLKRACDYHGIDYADIEPETIEGVKKPLGVWDFDGYYSRFKTLGAKRYFVQYPDGHYSLTVSGVDKRVAVPYLIASDPFKDPMQTFDKDLYFAPGKCGKKTHTYIDISRSGTVRDYQGIDGTYHELSCIHLEESSYDLSISREYANFILGLKEEK